MRSVWDDKTVRWQEIYYGAFFKALFNRCRGKQVKNFIAYLEKH